MAYTLDRSGQTNNSGDTSALLLKVFSGEVLQQFREVNVMRPLITLRSIPFGKSASFPVLGKAYAVVHTPGTNLLGDGVQARTSVTPTTAGAVTQAFAHNERLIYVDNKLVSATLVPDVDEMMNHYELRSRYAGEMGAAISYAYDKACIMALLNGARIATGNGSLLPSEVGGGNGSGVGTSVGSTPTGPAIADALFAAAQRFDELDIPKTGRRAIVSPQMAYALIKDPQLYQVMSLGGAGTATWLRAAAGSAPATGFGGAEGFGNAALNYGDANWINGTIGRIAGIDIVVSNHIPSTDLSTGAAGTNFWKDLPLNSTNGNTYALNCSATKGVIFHESGIGGLQIRDLSVFSEWREEFQATFMGAKLIAGFSWLRPSSIIELVT